MPRFSLLLPLALAFAQPALADTPPPAPQPPKLVVAIAVDQFAADLYAQYRQHFTGGFARLEQGAVFPSAFQSHAATETCPGHSTILTGVHPARSGIIANNWYDPTLARDDKKVYCAEDESDANSTPKEPVVSAVHLRVPTLGERMKAAWPQSRNVAVSGKDRAAMMMGGHVIDEGYWWQGRGFSTLNGRSLAPEVLAENGTILAALAKGAPGYAVPAWCAARARTIHAGPADAGVDVGGGRFALEADQPDSFRVSPRLDAAVLDIATRLAATMKLGKGQAPDLLSISLSATDYVGHAYGHQGQEMCIQMAQLDAALGAFFARIDALGVDYVVVLTADHGGLDVPERLAQQGLPAATRATAELTAPELSQRIATALGLRAFIDSRPDRTAAFPPPPPALIFGESAFGDYYVTRDLPADTRARVVAMLADTLRASPQVALVLTREELMKTPLPAGSPQEWSLRERARTSFDPQRSGDIVSLLNRAVVPVVAPAAGYTATHGSPWDYDRRVPLLFWRRGIAGFEQPAPVETVDIAPTLAALIGLKVPDGAFDGRCLDIDGGAANSCAGR
ncbi:MAG: alkaline phosphatase family protein [Sphingomonadales bacterium]|nr:alkaline phosphatase family protein [Sphingomonadales bacterium]